MAVLVTTLGFDEKFAARSVMRNLDKVEELVVVTAKPLDERAQTALRNLETLVSKYVGLTKLREVSVDPSDFYRAVSTLKGLFQGAGEYIVNVSGGMRILLLELLIALTITRPRGVIEVEFENLSSLVTVPIRLLNLPALSSEEEKVLRVLLQRGEADVSTLRSALDMPRSTLYQHLKSLRGKDLIVVERVDKRAVYRAAKEAILLA